MKETFYFSHDYNARNDEKIVKLISKEKLEGYGIFWILIEKLYEADGYLKRDYDCLAFDIRTNSECIKRVIENYNLFVVDKSKFYSKSVLNRLNLRKEKSEKARKSVEKRWNNTNVIRTKNDSNTIKESKGKESKYINQKINSKFPIKNKDGTYTLWDGTRVRNYFGAWVDAKDNGIKIDLNFYKELTKI